MCEPTTSSRTTEQGSEMSLDLYYVCVARKEL